jgi:hypothetical protein
MITFEQWQEQAQSTTTIDLKDSVRDCYIFPNGVRVMEDFVTPRNPFKKSFSLVVVDYTVPMTTKIDHAEVSDDYYTEEGFGVPVFRGDDAMEHAFNYAKELI